VGAGSGAIAIALAVALPAATIIATDTSAEALAIAIANARRHHVENRIAFRYGDLLAPIHGPVDLIVANLPYVTTADYLALPPEIRDHEPRGALDGGPDGLDVIRRLLTEAPAHLASGGAICLEFGVGQEETLLAAARQRFPSARMQVKHDMAGRPRVLAVLLG
jgi:release factor glutamine methyltransferase